MEKRPLQHLGVVAIEKGAFGSPSTKVTHSTYFVSSDLASKSFLVQSWDQL